MASERTRSGVLMVRAWFEDGPGEGFRVRILGRLDIEQPDEVYDRAAATPEQACSAVCEWLEAFAAGPG
jgi:hypothetical protein